MEALLRLQSRIQMAAEAGFKEFYINGEKQDDNYIPASKLTPVTEVRMVM